MQQQSAIRSARHRMAKPRVVGGPAPSMAAAASDFSLEELAYQYATDKSHDDHKYTDLCTPLSAPTRPLARCYA